MSTITPLPEPGGIASIVAAELRSLLGRHGKTQRDLALLIGVSQSQMSKRMRGTVPIDIFELEKIAGYFGVSIASLVGGQGSPTRGGGPDGTPSGDSDDGFTISKSHSPVAYLRVA